MQSQHFKQLSDVDLRLLRIYKAVVEAGGFAAAEVKLNISRSAISMAISDLETRLNLHLCVRGRAGFSVTDKGRHVYKSILELFSAIRDFRSDINNLHQDLYGEFNIGITDSLITIPNMNITNSLANLKQQAPKVIINISMTSSKSIEQQVLSGNLHAGVIASDYHLAEFEYLPLYSERSLLYCSREHPLFGNDDKQITKSIIASQDVAVDSNSLHIGIKKNNQEPSCDFKVTATANDREGVGFLILTGAYIGFLPEHLANPWVEKQRMRALMPEIYNYKSDFSIIMRKGNKSNLILDYWLTSCCT